MKTYIKIIACIDSDCKVECLLEEKGIPFVCEMIGESELANELEPLQLQLFQLKLKMQKAEPFTDKDGIICKQINRLIRDYVFLLEESKNSLLIDFFGESMYFTYKYISGMYSSYEGKTIEERLNEEKIERVKQMIREEDLTFDHISRIMRFSSPQHLSNNFKKKEHITMKEYKKRYKIKK
jgi:AraC family transcriptional regulator